MWLSSQSEISVRLTDPITSGMQRERRGKSLYVFEVRDRHGLLYSKNCIFKYPLMADLLTACIFFMIVKIRLWGLLLIVISSS